jgi:hypothetical protein
MAAKLPELVVHAFQCQDSQNETQRHWTESSLDWGNLVHTKGSVRRIFHLGGYLQTSDLRPDLWSMRVLCPLHDKGEDLRILKLWAIQQSNIEAVME